MTRFIYLSDTHWGPGIGDYKLQPKYDQQLPGILAALRSWIDEHGAVDFVLHGGDLIHETSEDSITAAAGLLDLSVPVYLCLGNHDLTIPGALDEWLRLAPQLFGDEGPNYAVETADCMVHIMPNHYGPTPFLWENAQEPWFMGSQIEALEERIESHPGVTHLLLTHSPVHPIESDQSGFEDVFHQPPAAFTTTVTDLADRHGLACVLSAHSHANSVKQYKGVHYITTSSFVETPFEFKLFEVGNEGLVMETHSLWDRVDFRADYDWNSTFVQGRARDRGFAR